MAQLIIYFSLLANSTYVWTENAPGCSGHFYDDFVPDSYAESVSLCKNGYFFVSYSPKMFNPDYIVYKLTYNHMKQLQGGRRGFLLDDDLKRMKITQASPNSDAFGPDYNRGHLASSHCMSWNKSDNGPWYDAYMMSNIAPQQAVLNQKYWSNLESHIINWILDNINDLYVITGVAYDDRSNPIRRADNIAQPDYFYMVICDPTNQQSAGFYGNNINVSSDVYTFRPVSQIEKLAGLKLIQGCNKDAVYPKHWWNFSDPVGFDMVIDK